MVDWESKFRAWAKPASETEQAKQENAERMIRAAISASPKLLPKDIVVKSQGSYRNNTNVPRESDVDVYVMLRDSFWSSYDFAQGFGRDALGFSNATYDYPEFKNDVEAALVEKFGRSGVRRGGKAFDIRENSYRVDADVVACLEHRRYLTRLSNGDYFYESGTEFKTDSGLRIINWPDQQYSNGVEKNQATGGRFKAMTRVLKNLRNEMSDAEIAAAKPIPSFLVECLVWNAADNAFGHESYYFDLREVLATTFNGTIGDDACKDWREVSNRKFLFHVVQPWTRQQAHAFLSAAWNYVGFN